MTTPVCTNRNCFDADMLYQRTDFDNGRITEIYRCARCKREYEQVATTLAMLPDAALCAFCGSELTELNRNEHGNVAYDCPICGIVHSSDFREAEDTQRSFTVGASTVEITRVDDTDLLAALRDGSEAQS